MTTAATVAGFPEALAPPRALLYLSLLDIPLPSLHCQLTWKPVLTSMPSQWRILACMLLDDS